MRKERERGGRRRSRGDEGKGVKKGGKEKAEEDKIIKTGGERRAVGNKKKRGKDMEEAGRRKKREM